MRQPLLRRLGMLLILLIALSAALTRAGSVSAAPLSACPNPPAGHTPPHPERRAARCAAVPQASEPSAVPAVAPQATNLPTAVASIPLGLNTFPTINAVNLKTNRIYVSDNCFCVNPPAMPPPGVLSAVAVIDGSTNTKIDEIHDPAIICPAGIATNAVTNRIYVASIGNNCTDNTLTPDVAVIDGATDRVIASVPVGGLGGCISHVAVNALTNLVYVADYCNSAVEVIDGATNTLKTTIALASGAECPVGIGVNVVTNLVYVVGNCSGNLYVISGATNTLLTTATYAANGAGTGLDVDPVRNRIYINSDGNPSATYVIDGTTNGVIGTILMRSTFRRTSRSI